MSLYLWVLSIVVVGVAGWAVGSVHGFSKGFKASNKEWMGE